MGHNARPLLLLGTRLLASELVDLLSEIPDFKLVGFVENMYRQRCAQRLEGLPVHWVDDIADLAATHFAVCALGTTLRSRFTEQVASLGFRFATLVHPFSRISSQSEIGEGSIISPGVVIASHTRLGCHVFVNRGALIGHHTHIGDYVSIMPGANVAGACRIGEATYIGMGALVLDHVKVGAHSVVGAGAVVNKDVPDHVQVVGVPARIVKENISGR
jgi:acetyltransferase EpsM